MSPLDVVTYVGSTSATGFDDLTPGPALAQAVARADGLVILEPLSFPWDAFETPPRCPVIVDLDDCSDHDVTALVPVLSILTPSDLLLGEKHRVERVCDALGLATIWGQRADIDAHIETAARSKPLDVHVRMITDRFDTDDVTIVILSGDEVRSARHGFPALVADVRDRNPTLTDAELDGIWGVHLLPGEPVERAVLAFRASPPPVHVP